MRNSFALFLTFIFLSTVTAQPLDHVGEQLDSIGTIFHTDLEIQPLQDRESYNIVPLKFHIIHDGSSWYHDSTRVYELIDRANFQFSNANIHFVKCGAINFIHDNEFANDASPHLLMDVMHPTHGVDDVINVYIPNTTITWNGYSYSGPVLKTGYNVNYNGLVINGVESISNDPTLFVHELGHYFGLYHTRSDPFNEELVDGSNCEIAGDYCCDTPAEHNSTCCRIASCEYVPLWGETFDENGDTLRPDVTNIMCTMAYDKMCPDFLSEDQFERIAFYYDTYLSDLHCVGGFEGMGIQNIKLTQQITVTQNLIEQLVIVNFSQLPSNYTILITDLSGRLVYSSETQNKSKFDLNISNFNTGIYILSVIINSERQNFKFIAP